MGRRALVGTVATLGLVALVGLFASLFLLFSSPIPAYAQGTNSAPTFTEGATATRNVDENTAAYQNIGAPIAATDSDTDDRLTYSIKNAGTSPFTIVRSTGQLQVGQPLDHETQETYTVVVQVTDSEDADGTFENPAVIDDTITVTITVNNVEEAESVSLSWKQPQVRTPITASLTDLDGINSGPTWQWAEANTKTGNYTDLTGNGATSATYTPQPGDSGKYLRATATYTDGEDASKTAQAVSYRAVRDAPLVNAAPAFRDVPTGPGGYSCSPYQVDAVCRYIPQNTPVGGDIYYPVKATDSDHDEIRYSVGGTDADLFRIDRSGGTLFTTKTHAFNDKISYSITITATDPSGASDSITITLTPSGGGHNPVVIGPDRIEYPENGTWLVAAYPATTAEEELGYTHGWIVGVQPGGGDGNFFRMDDDGRLTFIQPPDFENPADEGADNTYSFSIEVYHTNVPPERPRGHTVGINVTVTVVDVPNEALEIDGPSAVRYAENGTGSVAKYSLTDPTETVQWVLSGDDGNEFNIGADGALTFNESPDYENPTDTDAKNDYLVDITAYTPTDAKTEFIRVEVTNVNEPPTFDEGNTATRSVDSTAEVNDPFGDPILATDPDDHLLTYRLPDDFLPFSISPSTGQLWVDDELAENIDSYLVTVEVTDGADAEGIHDPHDPDGPGGSNTDDTIIVTVNVDGAGSNNAPEFPAGALSFDIDEKTATVVNVGTPVTATDDDTDDTLTYSLGGTDAGFFTIGNTSGQIQTKANQNYDFETKPTYSVTVTADDDNGGTATKDVTITLNNLDEDGMVNLSTNQPTARVAITATVTDLDKGVTSVTWQWAKSSDGSDPWTNVGTDSSSYTPADDDFGSYLRATASYTDDQASGKTAQAQTTQTVQTGTNRPADFSAPSTTREVAENTAAGQPVDAAVTATDADSDDLTYSLSGGDASLFDFDTGTGQIKVKTGTTLDYEGTRNRYTVSVEVTDSKNADGTANTAMDDSITVTINVTDVDEDGTVSLSMTQPSARTPITATLTDPDSGVTSESWQWAKADIKGGNYTDITGGTIATYTPADGDVNKFLKAKVSYEDYHGQNQIAEVVSDNAVQAGANRAPTFAAGAITLTVPENLAANVNVGSPITATDPDTGNTLEYSLDARGATLFDIDSGGGQIKTKSGVTYDHETTPSYSVTVTADDKNTGTATKDVTINVTDVDEDGTVSLSMTHPSARTSITATLTDPDSGVTGESWQWAKADTKGGNYTDITGGTTATYTPADEDVDKFLRATVSYEDDHDNNQTAEAVSDNAVQAGSNRAPTFDTAPVTLTVDENSAANVDVGSPVTATDLDTVNTLTYTLEGTDKDSFKVVSDGQIQTKSGMTYDYETKPSYSVTVKADDGNNGTATKDVTITLNNLEEYGTVTLSTYQPSARAQVTATLTDPDGGVTGTTWQWSKSDSQSGSYTNISGATSANYTPPDGDASKFLKATASYDDDQGIGRSAEATTTAAVQTGTNRPPDFGATSTTREVAENTAAGQLVGAAVTATDDDNDDLTYSMSGGDASLFDFDTGTGQIKVKTGTTLDYEGLRNSYTMSVEVTDGKNADGTVNTAMDDSITVTINVTNVNEDGTVSLSMTHPSARTQLTATLTDPDGGVTNESWQWAKADAQDGTYSDINGETSATYTPADADVGKFLKAKVSYDDDEDTGKTAEAVSANAVQAGANRTPTFSTTPITRAVRENTSVVEDLGGRVTATDGDNDTLTYSLEGTDKDDFHIIPGTGQIQTKSGVTYDYETKASYSVTVKADDGNSGTDTKEVTIDVTDVEEVGTVTLPMTQPLARTQLTATLTDPDGGVTGTTWKWARSDAQDGTYIDISSATSATYTPADEDVDKFLRATASYEDRRGLNKTAVAVSANAVGSGANRAPDFGATPATRSVPENSSPGEDVGVPFTADDLDNGDKLTYSLEGTDASYFHIDPDSGQIRTITGVTYDHETKTSYSVTVNVDDGNGAADTIDVVITVTDVNEQPAFLATESGKRTIAENTQANTNIGAQVTATDKDASETLTYRLSGKHAEFFSIDPSSGQLKTHGPLDHETQGTLYVTVEVRDSRDADGNTDTKTDAEQKVEITVIDVNEPPEFPSTETRIRAIVENTGAGQDIGVPVAAVDPDKGASLTYTLGETTDAASFDIVSTSGQLRTKSALDHEAEESYTVIISVHDGKNAAGGSDTTVDDDITVTITVTDVNDQPEFPAAESGARSIAENMASNINIGSPVRATDADDDNLTYTLEGVEAGSFAIDESSGQLKTKSALDHEDKDSYKVTVKASDGKDGVDTINVTITVTDVNEAPNFGSLTATRTVLENTRGGQPVGQPVPATDPEFNTLTYTLGGTDSASFGISSSTGQITVGVGTTLDFETKPSYEVTVTATDSLNLSDTITVTIKVTEGNDPPVFATDTATRSVAENTGTGLDIGVPFTATDAEDETLNYTLEGTDAASFGIVSTSGQLQTKVALDYEVESSYSVTVKAADAGASGTITVTITVTDVNEPPLAPGTPAVSGDSASSVSVTWTAPANAGKPDITGYDYQYKKTGEPTWSGATYATTGVVTSATISGLDSSTSYDVQARAKNDEGTGPWSATGAGSTGNTIPAFSSPTVTRDVAENTPADVNIGDPVTATDDDNGDSLTYTIGGTDAASFDIDSKTGQLKTKALLDREAAKNTYTVIVTATDSANAIAEATVTITVTNVNEPPHFGVDAANRKVDENTPPGDPVGPFVSAEDDDAGDTLTYSLGGADSASFGMDSSTGLITVGSGTRLDFETRTSYEVTVTATDSSFVSATITVAIEVLNVNEDGVVTLSQLQPQVDTLLRATLVDPDRILSGPTWKWEILPDNTNWGAIAGETSASYTPVSQDVGKFLRVTASYSDGEGVNKTAQAAAANAVQDVPATNAAPVLPSQPPTLTVTENTGAGENVGAPVAATDADQDTLTYKLSGADEPSFFIVAASGQIQTKAPLDHEAKSTYTVTVTATDPSDESDDVTVTITVSDVDEPPLTPGIPAMTQNTQTSLTMAWTAPSSTGRPAVTDYDYQYKKTAENTWTEVTTTPITDTSVEITGLETTTYYHVQVWATNDEGTGDWSASGIGVTRTLPNTPPEFPGSTTERHVTENTEERENVGNPVDARDTDNDPLTYILEGTDADSFMIDESTGQLKTMMPLDHEVKDSYSVLVKAEDGRGGSDTIGVTIKVTNVNEPPKFAVNLGAHSVPEDTAPGVNIGTPVAATDEEDDPLTYSLDSAGVQAFAIDALTGQLQTKAALDYETARVHSVIVYVRDGKDDQGATDTAADDDISVTITVTNVNEPPAFTESAPSRSVPENSVIGTDVGYPVTAADPEVDTLTYSLDGTDKASFSIDRSSGQLKTRTALDFESGKRSYSVTVSVSDGKKADGNADTTADATVTVTIAVTDENEAPEATIRSTVRYAENDTDPVDTYTATDPERGTITWTLPGTDMDDFRISKVNDKGVLEFRTPPNFEAPADTDTNNVYLVTVEVSDGNTSDALEVTVTVFNVNEPPAFPAETGARNVDENTAAGQNLGDAVAAVDPERDTLIYKLAGTDGASFAIDTATGQLRTRAPLDYETESTYLVTVHVRDSLDQDDRVNAVTDDTINITITINNVDEPGSVALSSRQPQATTPFTATIIDPDGGVTRATWVWARSTDKNNWSAIPNATSASYTPVAAADSGKYLRVTASYTDGHDSGKIAVGVSDNPVRAKPATNDAPEFPTTENGARDIDEGTAAGQNIGAPVAATDPDNGDANLLTYSLGGTDKASFDIVRATGQLLTKAPLDHEDKETYTVTVTVVDPSLLSALISVTIIVNDVDEPPVLSGPDVVDYPENGTGEVAQYTADDPENDSITWSLEGDDKDLFNISGGVLTFKSSPDHDAPADADGNSIYMVTVKVTARTTSVTLPVEVTVSNVNEAPDFPASETGGRTVAENTAADEDIGAPVAATDPDNGDTLTYTLGGADAGSFAIDETTGQLKTKDTLNYEAKDTYTVTVTATDSSGLSETITVTIIVTSVNEVPEFTDGATAARSIAENTPADQDIGAAVGATDPENGDTLTYTLGGDDATSFAIVEASGQLTTRDPLDYETKAGYSVTVSVSDGKDIDGNNDPSADNTIDVTISVTDLNDAGTVILSSLQPQVGTPITARLEDPDDATDVVSWTWESSSNWSSGWTATSGAKSDTYTPLDTYTPVTGDLNKYLRATASYTNSASAQVSAHGISAYPVRAEPASNVPPAFATATRSVPEDTPVGGAVGDPVTATDSDADDVLTYSLSGTDAESFSIGMASGQLRTKAALDHDTKASYMVVVTAADPSGLSDTITVTISVTDQNEPPVISGKASVYYTEDRTDAVAAYTANDPENGSITWSLAGDDSGDFSISARGVLTFSTQPDLENPADKDADNVYLVTVQASDGPNTVPLDVTVTVTDAADPPPAPGAPTVEAAATDGHTALSVSWQAPATTSVSPITGYDVEYRKQGSEDWSSDNVTVTETGTSAAITGVLPDTLYEVRVRAENADGWGTWSEPGTGRTEVTPLDQQVDLTVGYQAAGYTVNEGATRAVSVTLSEAADRALQVPITVALLTAESGDYRVTGLTAGALAFVPGDSSKSFTFEALQDTDTSDETVTLGFGQSLPDKVTAGNRTTSVVTIDDDDPVQSSRRRRSGGGGGGGGGNFGSSSSTNKAPVFTEGTSASRSVTENTAAGVNIGAPVTATDGDRDTLTYTVGGDDGSTFAIDRATGQLKTKSALDFETKSTYRVTMGVFDPTGGSDTITVTITVTDVADVSLVNGTTQMIGVVDSERDTTVSTLDGSVAVTFPSGSQSGDYQVRLDHGLNNCNPNFANEELWFCLTVDIFDNEGNLEQGVVLSRPATIKIRRNGDERGGVDAALGLHAQGGVSVYTRGRTGGEWTESAFTLESDGVGGIVITITGVSSFGLYAGTTDSSVPVQVSHQVATVPVPTATPQNTGGQESSPEPTPTPTPTPQPGSSSEQSTTPDPTPTPEPVATQGTNPTPEPTLGHQVSSPFGPLGVPAATPTPAPTPVGIAKGFGNLPSAPPQDGDSVPTAEPEVKGALFDSEGGKSEGVPPWYIGITMLALVAMIAGGSTYFVKRRQRLPYPVTVQRSREFNKWWSGW